MGAPNSPQRGGTGSAVAFRQQTDFVSLPYFRSSAAACGLGEHSIGRIGSIVICAESEELLRRSGSKSVCFRFSMGDSVHLTAPAPKIDERKSHSEPS